MAARDIGQVFKLPDLISVSDGDVIYDGNDRRNRFRHVLQNINDRLEDSNYISVSDAKDAIDHIQKERHDLFCFTVMDENGIDVGQTDVDPIMMARNYLITEGLEDEKKRIENNISNAAYVGKRTPDIVKITMKPDGRVHVTMVDVAVSYNPDITYDNKLEKYRHFLKIFGEEDSEVEVIVYNLITRSVMRKGIGKKFEAISTPDTTDLEQIITDALKTIEVIKVKLTPEGREELALQLKDGKYNDSMGEDTMVEMDFAITPQEFTEKINQMKNGRVFFGEMSEQEKVFFFSTMMNNCEEHEEDIVRALSNLSGNTFIADKKDYEQEQKEWLKREMDKSVLNEPAEGLPSKPNKESMEIAFDAVKQKAKESFDEKVTSGLLYPIPFNYSKTVSDVKGELLKKDRMLKYLEVIDLVKEHEKDDTLSAIEKILSHAKLVDEDYKSFKNGEFVMMSNGNRMTMNEFQSKASSENKEKQRDQAEMSPEKDEELVNKWIGEGKVFGARFKKGEVLVFRPHNVRQLMTLLRSAGVGMKKEKELNSTGVVEKGKVESMNFWDNDKMQGNSREYRRIKGELKHILMNMNVEKIPDNRPDSPDNKKSDESSDDVDEEKLDNFENNMRFLNKYNQVLWENINHVGHMASSGFRIVQGLTDNTIIITMPGDSHLKGRSEVPYIVVSLQRKGDIHYNYGDHREKSYKTRAGTIHVTLGRRVDRNRMAGYMRAADMFIASKACSNADFKKNMMKEMNAEEQLDLFLYCNNININSSSLLDNVRYLVDAATADYSFAAHFIKDKMLVPAKNVLQVDLFEKTIECLGSLNESLKQVRIKPPTVDDEGEVNMDNARVVGAAFPSFFYRGRTYIKLESLVSELYNLFFCLPKGLHDKFHNQLEIHKTPLKFEEEVNNTYSRLNPCRTNGVESRFEYNPRMMVESMRRAEDNLTMPRSQIRKGVVEGEKMNGHPLTSRTMSSTRSLLVYDEAERGSNQQCLADTVLYSHMSEEERVRFTSEVEKFERNSAKCNKYDLKKRYLKFKAKMVSIFPTHAVNVIDLLNNQVRFNFETRILEFSQIKMRTEARNDTAQILKKAGGEAKFYSSGVVITEMLNNVAIGGPEGHRDSIGKMSKLYLKSNEDVVFAIRPKGQRTQKDREIFILNIVGKFLLYPLEHTFKQMCFALPEENISVSGDNKIIKMQQQVKYMQRHLARVTKENKDEAMKPYMFHFNLDMTKWAPKDNLFKFIWIVIASRLITLGEKLYMIAALIKYSEKLMYLDEELFRQTEKQQKSFKDNITPEGQDGCIFSRMTNGHTRNLIPITLTWLQGQLNYMSSIVHSGTMLLWSDKMKTDFPNGALVQVNAHSDDGQNSMAGLKSESDDEFIERSWRVMDYFCKQVCMEISVKKSVISRFIKQFVSQHNIGGEQSYIWVKPALATISGCPYTNLKDDFSSVMSKGSEALSKGAPKEAISIIVNCMKRHLLRVYGILSREGKNKFAELLGIQEKYLPTCLGGCEIVDYTTLAMSGPKSMDQSLIMELLKTSTATVLTPPERLPFGNERKKGLQILCALDSLSGDCEDEEQSNHTSSMNPLRCGKFKNRRLGNKDPFDHIKNPREKEEKLKEQNPGLTFMKPKNRGDLINYYFILFQNSNFRASLAGQSPNLLMLHKMVNKKKGIFKFKASGNVNDKNSRNLTPEEVATVIIAIADKQIGDSLLKMSRRLWSKYVKSDPEFKVLWFCHMNAKGTTAVSRPNSIAMKKPDFSEYSDFVNNISSVLVCLFDQEYAARSNITIRYKKSLINDIIRLHEMFPYIMDWIKQNARASPEKFKLYVEVMQAMNVTERNVVRKHRDNYTYSTEKMDMQMRLGMENELRKIMQTEDQVIDEDTSTEKVGLKIGDMLLKVSRTFKMTTVKILSVIPSKTRSIMDISLSLRSQIESDGKSAVVYYLTNELEQTARMLLLQQELPLGRLTEFCQAVANYYQMTRRMGVGKDEMRSNLVSLSMFGLTLMDVYKSLAGLNYTTKNIILVPLCAAFPELANEIMNKINPSSITWEMDESGQNLEYTANMEYENLKVQFRGQRKRVVEMDIVVRGEIRMNSLMHMIKVFGSDLMFRVRNKMNKVRLFDLLQTRKRELNEGAVLGFCKARDSIVEIESHLADHVISGVTIRTSKEKRRLRDFSSTRISTDQKCVEYLMENSVGRYYHRTGRSDGINHLNFYDNTLCNLRLSRVVNSSLYRNIMDRTYGRITISELIKCESFAGSVALQIGGASSYCILGCLIPEAEFEAPGDMLDKLIVANVENIKYGEIEEADFMSSMYELNERDEEILKKKAVWDEYIPNSEYAELKMRSTPIRIYEQTQKNKSSPEFIGRTIEEMMSGNYSLFLKAREIDEKAFRDDVLTPSILFAEAGADQVRHEERIIMRLCVGVIKFIHAVNKTRFQRVMRTFWSKYKYLEELRCYQAFEMACIYHGKDIVQDFCDPDIFPMFTDGTLMIEITKRYTKLNKTPMDECYLLHEMTSLISQNAGVVEATKRLEDALTRRGAKIQKQDKVPVSKVSKAIARNPTDYYRNNMKVSTEMREVARCMETDTESESAGSASGNGETDDEIRSAGIRKPNRSQREKFKNAREQAAEERLLLWGVIPEEKQEETEQDKVNAANIDAMLRKEREEESDDCTVYSTSDEDSDDDN